MCKQALESNASHLIQPRAMLPVGEGVETACRILERSATTVTIITKMAVRMVVKIPAVVMVISSRESSVNPQALLPVMTTARSGVETESAIRENFVTYLLQVVVHQTVLQIVRKPASVETVRSKRVTMSNVNPLGLRTVTPRVA